MMQRGIDFNEPFGTDRGNLGPRSIGEMTDDGKQCRDRKVDAVDGPAAR